MGGLTRDEVLQKFAMWNGHPNPPRPLQTYWHNTDAMFQEIAKLRARVAWLENEIDMIDGIAAAATDLMNAPLDGRDLYIRKVIDAARTYRDGSLDDDGTEP